MLNELADKVKEARKEYNAEAKKYLDKAIKDLFIKHPELYAVKWNQYTPHFNDGEPCTFSVHELEYLLKKEVVDLEDDIDVDEDYEWLGRAEGELYESLSALSHFIEDVDNEQILASLFGDGVSVVATENGIETEDYDHD